MGVYGIGFRGPSRKGPTILGSVPPALSTMLSLVLIFAIVTFPDCCL